MLDRDEQMGPGFVGFQNFAHVLVLLLRRLFSRPGSLKNPPLDLHLVTSSQPACRLYLSETGNLFDRFRTFFPEIYPVSKFCFQHFSNVFHLF